MHRTVKLTHIRNQPENINIQVCTEIANYFGLYRIENSMNIIISTPNAFHLVRRPDDIISFIHQIFWKICSVPNFKKAILSTWKVYS